MRVKKLHISGFRGIHSATILFNDHSVFIGPNGCGKSTIVDALSLVLGRPRIVRPLTEHDFIGSNPSPADRITIIASIVGFSHDNPDLAPDWFRAGRAVPKWVDEGGEVHPLNALGRMLCAEVGFSARFDHDDLTVETIRYFHDGGIAADPFDEIRPVEPVPQRLVNELGFFVLPARRSWEGMVSFGSDLFRKTVSNAAGLPSNEILAQRDFVRNPPQPVEESPALAPLVSSMNEQLSRLLIEKPRFKLRLTAGDTEGVLQALIPHFETNGVTLPVSRHGAGLLSLQTLLLLLEVGRARQQKGQSFILAMEEPELHLAPGLQGRLVAEAIAIASQTVCTTHAPGVAMIYPPTNVMVMNSRQGVLSALPMLERPLNATATSDERKLYSQGRGRFLTSLMHPFILVPEGRFDWEWLERLAGRAEHAQKSTPFSTIFGIAPTENSGVKRMAEIAKRLRPSVIPLVDGDSAGDEYVRDIASTGDLTEAIVQWPPNWTIEDVIGWIVEGSGEEGLVHISETLDSAWTFTSCSELVTALKAKGPLSNGRRGLKDDLIAHDAIISTLTEASVARAARVLDALTSIALNIPHPNYIIENPGPPRRARFATA